jgi:FKBP-type peptidyl-prolyl cis-trans isomerase
LLALAISVCGMAMLAQAAEPPAPATPPAGTAAGLATDELKIAYTIGFLNGTNALRYRLRPEEWKAFLAGLEDAHAKQTAKTDAEAWRPKIQAFVQSRDAETSAENKKAGAEALAKAAAETGARKLPSGLVIKTTKEGTGAQPKDTDQVKVKYSGKLINGTEFDNSEKHGGSATFVLSGVIPCWTEGLKLMKVGEIAELYCPPEIAYGDRGAGPVIPGGSTLHFTVELLEVNAPPSPAAPGSAAPPKPTP